MLKSVKFKLENHFFSLCYAIMDYTKFYIALWHQRAVQPPVMFNYMLGDEIKGSVYAETKSWSLSGLTNGDTNVRLCKSL